MADDSERTRSGGAMREVHISATMSDGATMTAKLSLKVNLAVQHLLAASRFSREVGQVEAQHFGEEFGGFWESIFHSAVACILTSVASLEAYANELFSDRTKVFPGHSPELLHELWASYEQKSILKKFEFALLLAGKPGMDVGARPYQDIKVLVGLRNALTHFHPEWMDEPVEHAKISSKLNGVIAGSRFLQADERLFPRKWASHNCTQWAVRSVLAFARNFEQIAGLDAKYKSSSPTAFEP